MEKNKLGTIKTKIISLNIDDIGVSKLNRIKLKFCPKKLRDLIRVSFDKLDSRRIRKIKKLALDYGLPITWAVVPYYFDTYSSQKIRFDEALPEMYDLIKKYLNQGDEVIQHGNCHFFPDKEILSNEEFCTLNKRVPLEKQKELIEDGWKTLIKIGLKPKKIMQFPAWKADNNSMKALMELKYKGVLAKNFLNPQNILQKRAVILSSKQIKLYDIDLSSVFRDDEPVNLIMHPSQKIEFDNLKRLLEFSRGQKVKFVKTSENLNFF